MTRYVAALVLTMLAIGPVYATGEAVGPFPNWEERVVQELMNRARVSPSTELSGCGTNCSAAELAPTCYGPVAPLPWSDALNRSSRFHSASMGRNGFFAHDTPFIVRSDIGSLYPTSCDGSAACASSGAGSTSPGTRISYFGGSFAGEIIAAGQTTPYSAFYTWLYETTPPTTTCSFTSTNGHRYLILTSGPAVGVGYVLDGASTYGYYWTGDFGSPATSASKIPSGSHWGSPGSNAPNARQASSVDFWVNWYDAAAPIAENVVVDGVSHPMSLGRGTSTNGAWTVTLGGLETGCHRYFFSFQDSGGQTVRYPTTGTLGVGPSATCADWTSGARADFNNDGHDDLLWSNSSTGDAVAWFMNGTTLSGSGGVASQVSPSWTIAGTGDFNQDGNVDIVWHNSTTGDAAIWTMSGTTRTGAFFLGSVPLDWNIAGVGDFNGDGKPDLVWRSQSTGTVNVWFMNGTAYSGTAATIATVSPAWRLEVIGDFDHNGTADLVWRSTSTGETDVWFMNGTSLQSSALMGTVSDQNWRIAAAGDYNDDGNLDLVWRHLTAGSDVVWYMNGASRIGSGTFSTVGDTRWNIVGPR